MQSLTQVILATGGSMTINNTQFENIQGSYVINTYYNTINFIQVTFTSISSGEIVIFQNANVNMYNVSFFGIRFIIVFGHVQK